MANKYISLNSGRLTEVEATVSSAGAGDAGELVALDNTGRLDTSVMPVGIGADTTTIATSENLSAGDFVNIWNDAGTPKARKAIADVAGKEACGFVLAATTAPANASVYHEGTNTQLTGLTAGSRYYLSAATAGTATATPPSATGNVVQFVGVAVSATALTYEASEGVIRA
jgi:hypothetical protein